MLRERMEKRYPGLFARLGVDGDPDLAVEYGISADRIGQLRRAHDITAPPRLSVEERYPGLLERLGTVPDSELAIEYGISNVYVGNLRRERHIPIARARALPTETEWEALLDLKGEITISSDRRTLSIAGTEIQGKSLRQALLIAVRGVE